MTLATKEQKETDEQRENKQIENWHFNCEQKQMNEYLRFDFNLIWKGRSNQKQFLPYAATTPGHATFITISQNFMTHEIAKKW